ncbi:MAG: tetratricopeptide repeat protein [Planctomycetes bacterium]|nr:tetratricopeptide repeat protein [Planctomycetota bacterium]
MSFARRAASHARLAAAAVAVLALGGAAPAPRDSDGCAWDPEPNVHFGEPYKAIARGVQDWEGAGLGTPQDPEFLVARMDAVWAAEEGGDWGKTLELARALLADARAALRLRRSAPGWTEAVNMARERVDLFGSIVPLAGALATAPAGLAVHLRGRRALEQGDCAAAKDAFDAVLADAAAAPLHPFASLGRAAALFRAGEFPAATTALEALVAGAPRASVSPRARYLLARACLATGEAGGRAGATATASALFEAYPEDDLADDALGLVGQAACLEGRWDDARDAYERLLERYPHGDMADEAEESLLYVVFRKLRAAGAPRRPIPPAVLAYLDCLVRLGAPGTGAIWAWLSFTSDPYQAVDFAAVERELPGAPAWLLDNLLYRLARRACHDHPDRAVARLLRLLAEFPEGDRAPVSLLLLGALLTEDKRPTWPLSPFTPPFAGPSRRAWGRQALARLALSFPASEYAPEAVLRLFLTAKSPEEHARAVAILGATYGRVAELRAWEPVFERLLAEAPDALAGLAGTPAEEAVLFFGRKYRELFERFPGTALAPRALPMAFDDLESRWTEVRNQAPHERWSKYRKVQRPDRAEEEEAVAPGDKDGEDEAYTAPATTESVREEARALVAAAERWLAGRPSRAGAALTRLELARSLLFLGRAEEALQACRRLKQEGAPAHREDEALWVETRALAALGRHGEAAETARELWRRFPEAEPAVHAMEEAAIACELAEDRGAALALYLDIKYMPDVAYLLDVLMDVDEIERFANQHSTHPSAGVVWYSLAVRRMRQEDFARAHGALRAAAEAGAGPPDSRLADNVALKGRQLAGMEAAWNRMQESLRPGLEAPDLGARVERLLAALGDDEPAVREQATAELEYLGRAAAERMKAGLRSPDPEVRMRVRRLLDRVAADAGAAAYAYARHIFEHDTLFTNEVTWRGGRVEYLSTQEALLRPEEADRLRRFQEEYNVKLRARGLFRAVAERFPDSVKAPNALYMAGVAGLRLFGYNSLVKEDERWLDGAQTDFLELVRRYPDSPLADDALFWAGYWDRNEARTVELYERIRREYPNGDVMNLVLVPSARTSKPNPSRHGRDEGVMQRFREHNKEGRTSGGE